MHPHPVYKYYVRLAMRIYTHSQLHDIARAVTSLEYLSEAMEDLDIGPSDYWSFVSDSQESQSVGYEDHKAVWWRYWELPLCATHEISTIV